MHTVVVHYWYSIFQLCVWGTANLWCVRLARSVKIVSVELALPTDYNPDDSLFGTTRTEEAEEPQVQGFRPIPLYSDNYHCSNHTR